MVGALVAACQAPDILVITDGGGFAGVSGPSDGDPGAGGTGGMAPQLCGSPGSACCPGNSCDEGGCCVPVGPSPTASRVCVAAGTSCARGGIAGTCANGSCSDCGGTGQGCCRPGFDGGAPAAPYCTATASCTGDLCAACGGTGQPCCQGALPNACLRGLGCVRAAGDPSGGTCGACGEQGQPCCNGTSCQSTLACAPDAMGTPRCVVCGGAGQPCCIAVAATSGCQMGFGCVVTAMGNRCATCGGPNQPCCGLGNNPTNACMMRLACTGRAPDNSGMCLPCGGPDQACCSGLGGQCQAPLGCLAGPMGNRCTTCGGANQPCCGTGNNGTCTAVRHECSGRGGGNPGTCTPCGNAGGPCCPSGVTCAMGSRCVMSQCQPCGARGQPCCATGPACQTGIMCSGPTINPASTCGGAGPVVEPARDGGRSG